MTDKRITIRLNEAEQLRLTQLKKFLHEEGMSKVIKFAIDTSIKHIENVTASLVSEDWDVLFIKKRKSSKLDRKFYD